MPRLSRSHGILPAAGHPGPGPRDRGARRPGLCRGAIVAVGGSTRLTFTVTNTTELGGKPRFSFAEALPAGLRVAAAPGYTTTCRYTSSRGVVAGGTSLLLRGSLAEGQSTCSYSIRVTGTAAGTKVSAPGTLVGLDPPAAASILVG